MDGGARRRVRVLEGLDLVDAGIGLKSEAKSMDGAMFLDDGNSPDAVCLGPFRRILN